MRSESMTWRDEVPGQVLRERKLNGHQACRVGFWIFDEPFGNLQLQLSMHSLHQKCATLFSHQC